MSLNYDLNSLTDLYTESTRLDDELRKRTTQSFLLKAQYSFTDRFAIESLVPFIHQNRTIFGNFGGEFSESSFGIGDPIFLMLYKLVDSDFNWRLGTGPQLPLGSTTKRNSRDLLMVEDLQPGSGALDWIFFSSLEYNSPKRPSLLWYSNLVYSSTGMNRIARGGNLEYEFGNDIQIILGTSDQFLVLNNLINLGLNLRYRYASEDEVNGNINPGTGGKWLFTRLTSGFNFSPSTSINISYERAVFTQVVDTQLSPTFVLNIGFSKAFDFNKNETNVINF